MFAIALKSEQYPTYVLSDQAADARLEVVPDRGGLITRWQINNQDILYFDAERFANPTLSVRGGVPILFPICGNLPDNAYTHSGQTYTLKQHGFARNLPWEVTDRGVQGGAHLTLALNSNEQTRAVYPFDFQLAFTYRLRGKTLEIQKRFTNRSDDPLPFSTGLHPYFEVTDKTQLAFDIPSTQFQDQNTKEIHPFTGVFDFNLDEIDIAFLNLTRNSASVTDAQRNLKLTLEWDENYSTLVFWTVKGKDYYCLEPWSAPRNALNTGDHLTTLAPGGTHETQVKMMVEGV